MVLYFLSIFLSGIPNGTWSMPQVLLSSPLSRPLLTQAANSNDTLYGISHFQTHQIIVLAVYIISNILLNVPMHIAYIYNYIHEVDKVVPVWVRTMFFPSGRWTKVSLVKSCL